MNCSKECEVDRLSQADKQSAPFSSQGCLLSPGAVNRHQKTIIACLRDSDVSIRRRALDLLFIM